MMKLTKAQRGFPEAVTVEEEDNLHEFSHNRQKHMLHPAVCVNDNVQVAEQVEPSHCLYYDYQE